MHPCKKVEGVSIRLFGYFAVVFNSQTWVILPNGKYRINISQVDTYKSKLSVPPLTGCPFQHMQNRWEFAMSCHTQVVFLPHLQVMYFQRNHDANDYVSKVFSKSLAFVNVLNLHISYNRTIYCSQYNHVNYI